MRQLLNATILFCFLLSCDPICKEDQIFKKYYFDMLDTISEYGKQFDTDSTIVFSEEKWGKFSEISDYMRLLTGCELHYTIIELPIYENQTYLESDLMNLQKWYDENKCGMTMAKADSIVNVRKKFN